MGAQAKLITKMGGFERVKEELEKFGLSDANESPPDFIMQKIIEILQDSCLESITFDEDV